MKKGFTLVEIMIVVAIIVLLAAIAIPNLLRARVNANEAAAVGALHTISTSAQSWRAVNTSYPTSLIALSNAAPPYIDDSLGDGTKQGYDFALTGATNTFTATARPDAYETTGVRSFFVDTSGVVTWTDVNAAATASDSELE